MCFCFAESPCEGCKVNENITVCKRIWSFYSDKPLKRVFSRTSDGQGNRLNHWALERQPKFENPVSSASFYPGTSEWGFCSRFP
jgi:hypothetical protein